MIQVRAGTFTMGSNQGDTTFDYQPAHRVRLTKGYWLYKTPVTNGQYRKFVEATGHPRPSFWDNDAFSAPEQPVVGVSWSDAMTYCKWAGCRLPTEAEWEYAARGTDGRTYPWGNQPPDASRAVFGANSGQSSVDRPGPVGQRPADRSPFGARDMAGNVNQWCADWYDEGYYRKSSKVDPKGPKRGLSRVLRGGSWQSSPDFLRSYIRDTDSSAGNYVSGFRPVWNGR